MQPTQISDLRVEKTGLILSLFVGGNELTRREVGSRTGISYGTISIILRQLLTLGIIERTGKESSNGGRRADTYRLIGNRFFFAQISVTSYGFLWTIRDLFGDVQAEGTETDNPDTSINELFSDVVAVVLKKASTFAPHHERLVSIGVSVPGHYKEATDTIVKPSRDRIADLNIRRAVAKHFDGTVIVESDVNAAAIVDLQSRDSAPSRSGTTLYVGVTADGIGSTIVIDGTIHYGATGHAGEIHMIPVRDGESCSTFGEVVDPWAVSDFLLRSGAFGNAPDFHSLRTLIRANDSRLSGAYGRIVDAFSQALYILDSVFDPDRIVLVGLYCGFGTGFAADVSSRLIECAEPHLMDDVVIEQAPTDQLRDQPGLWLLQAARWTASVEMPD